MRSSKKYIRQLVTQLHPYVPGEQPQTKGLIKLNTNENPFPPSPKVLKAIKSATDARLRLYPNPTAQDLRKRLARLHDCLPQNIIVGNGSDELLALATRAFVEPATSRLSRRRGASTIQYFTPSYSLYPILADIHGARKNAVPLAPDFGLPPIASLRGERRWDFNAALTYITTPNAPSGRGYATSDLEALCRAQAGIVILDEAYADFAKENAARLALKHSHVLVSRTFSKAYSLCFQRIGYFIGHPELIQALDKMRDSYNVNGLGQVAAMATLSDRPYYRRCFKEIIAHRERLARGLTLQGFRVLPSQTNFLLTKAPILPAKLWFTELRRMKILVRWFDHDEINEYLRITIGTEKEVQALLRAVRKIKKTIW